jgi:hypothetical protein
MSASESAGKRAVTKRQSKAALSMERRNSSVLHRVEGAGAEGG